jgi:hypothetical protein
MRNKLYLTVDIIPDGRIVGIITDGYPLRGDKKVTICTVKTFPHPMEIAEKLADEWFKRMIEERPWETRQ